MDMTQISKAVRGMRKQSGLTQNELAQLAGVGKTVVFDIEKGKETVQFNSLFKVFDVLNIRIKLELPLALSPDNK